ncbi:MAG: type II toxin-antitoxin system VapC family toxin [Verrucomicrobiae bacterium]|nr:type II toxin-antitoxin system VapC family toxin [Verrucomicrobiae bacterium]
MKPKLYLESTIRSYLVARPSRDAILAGQQECTRVWWKKRAAHFEIFVSDVVTDEIAAGEAAMAIKRLALIKPFVRLTGSEKARALTHALIHGGPLPVRAARDAAHIALSAAHGMHFLLTWNCTHIANATMYGKLREICAAHGCDCPAICTPEELLAE